MVIPQDDSDSNSHLDFQSPEGDISILPESIFREAISKGTSSAKVPLSPSYQQKKKKKKKTYARKLARRPPTKNTLPGEDLGMDVIAWEDIRIVLLLRCLI